MPELSEMLKLTKRVEALEAELKDHRKQLHDIGESADASKRYTGAFVAFAWLVDSNKARWSLDNNNVKDNPTTVNGINLAQKYPNNS